MACADSWVALCESFSTPMNFGSFLLILSVALSVIAWIWLIVVMFKNKETMWGVLLIVSPFILIGPIVALVLIVMKWNMVKRPAILMLANIPIAALGSFLVARDAQRALQELAQAEEFSSQVEETASATLPAPGSPEPTQALVVTGTEATASPAVPPPQPVSNPRPVRKPRTDFATRPPNSDTSSIEPPPSVIDTGVSPVQLDVISLSDHTPNRLRTVHLRIRNPSAQAVKELRLELRYLDAQGRPLGNWVTVHGSSSDEVAKGSSTNEFKMQAFFVPQFTDRVRLEVEGVKFADGTRWPARSY